MEEIWKAIPGYEGHYEVSNKGRVKSLKRTTPRLLKPKTTACGYLSVGLASNRNNKTVSIHRLVLLSFVGYPPCNYECHHLNSIKDDNRLTNLMWVTKKENALHKKLQGRDTSGERNSHAVLKEADVKGIIELLKHKTPQRIIAAIYGVTDNVISKINRGVTWKYLQTPLL